MNTQRLSRLAALRNRLRDQQSAETAEALARHVEGENQLSAARNAQQAFAAEQMHALETMTSAADSWRIEMQRGLHEAHVERHAEVARGLLEASNESRGRLRARTKDLRVVEKVLERGRLAKVKTELDRERRQVDDIVGARTKGEE